MPNSYYRRSSINVNPMEIQWFAWTLTFSSMDFDSLNDVEDKGMRIFYSRQISQVTVLVI